MSVTHSKVSGAANTDPGKIGGEDWDAAHVVSLSDADIPATIARDAEVTSSISSHAGLPNAHHNQSHTQSDHTGTGATSTQAFGDAASDGTGTKPANIDHKHAMPANPVSYGAAAAAVGTSSAGAATTVSRSDHVHATGAGTPSTQAFGDAAATGTGPAAAMTDHKHAMPTLGYGLSGNSAPALSLSTASAFVTATTSVSAATYADITGASISLAAGTWIIVAQVFGAAANLAFLMHAAITDNANAIVSEGSQFVPASGTASVNTWGNVTLHAFVTPASTTTYKLRAARGLTTLTNTWTVQDGSGVNVTNNASDNTDKGTGIFALRLA